MIPRFILNLAADPDTPNGVLQDALEETRIVVAEVYMVVRRCLARQTVEYLTSYLDKGVAQDRCNLLNEWCRLNKVHHGQSFSSKGIVSGQSNFIVSGSIEQAIHQFASGSPSFPSGPKWDLKCPWDLGFKWDGYGVQYEVHTIPFG